MRIIIIKVEIEDNDFIEQALFNELDGMLGQSMTDFTKLPDTTELYENDRTFRELCIKLKAARRYKNDYINKKKLDNKE